VRHSVINNFKERAMVKILEVEPMQQKIRIISPYTYTKYKTNKPYYKYDWIERGWEEIYIWDATPKSGIARTHNH
jgi:hypothetical protein